MKKPKKIKLIIFDWDEVFTLGSIKGYFACYHEALLGVGVHLSAQEEERRIVTKWGRSHREELGALLEERPELVDEACKIYEQHLFGETFVDCLSIVPGSIELLQRLHRKYVLAVATGAHPTILREHVIPKFGIPDVFSQIITAYDIDDPEKTKPHPHIAQLMMETQKCSPEETIIVGDAKSDVLMAQAANVTPVVVLSGHLKRKDAEALGVRYIIPDVTHLESVLDEMNSVS
jgi:HAD superfamily hydrolase (TIGR01509 family)